MRRLTLAIFTLLLLASCASYNNIELEVLLPSKYSFKSPVKHLVILNNANEQAPNVGHSNYQQSVAGYHLKTKGKRIGGIHLEVDSTTTNCIYNLYNYLSATEMYEQLDLVKKSSTQPKINSYTTRNYFKDYNADALLVLERLEYQDNYTVIRNKTYDTEDYELEVIAQSSWSIYFSQNPTQAYTFSVKDTLYWNKRNIDRSDCILHTVWENGAKAAKKISPHWQKSSRLYYAGTSYIYNQIELALANDDWTLAASYWKQIYDGQKKNKKTKGRMAYNMALFFEVENDFDSALSWIREASVIFTQQDSLYEVIMCQEYAKILQGRKVNKKKIDQQWGL